MKKCTVEELADLLNLSERRIYQLAEDKIIPKTPRGTYELKAVCHSYIKYLQDLAANKGSSYDQKDSKSRLLKARAEKAEFELEVLKDKYMEVSEVEFSWGNMVVAFRSRMLAIPSKLARSLAAAGNDFAKIERILEDEIYDALTELSKKAKLMPETLKTWINTSLGETWEEGGDTVDETSLLARKENWGDLIPQGVVIITAGVDVQDDRLELEIVGWGNKGRKLVTRV